MEFTFDVSQTPLIGRRLLVKSEAGSAQNLNKNNGHWAHNTMGTPNSPRRSTSLSPADAAALTGWKRPWLSQSRVRECLVNLLTTCGQRVGLPKSPSVCIIFSVFFVSKHRACEHICIVMIRSMNRVANLNDQIITKQ